MPSQATTSNGGLPLREFLKLLAGDTITMSEAIAATSKLAGSKLPLTALALSTKSKTDYIELGIEEGLAVRLANKFQRGKPVKRSRKRPSDLDQPLPTRGKPQGVVATNLEFEEILYEETLVRKSVVINRAPVMTAWAFIVAERLGFKRQEALSIASVYVDLNATSKGVALGIMTPKLSTFNASQPHIALMGRKIPVIQQGEEWRALTDSAVVEPSKAFSYMHRAFYQQLGAVIGAMRLLAESYLDPEELNKKGYDLYMDFRPESDGWGKRAEMKLSTILALRKSVAGPDDGAGVEEGDVKPVDDAGGVKGEIKPTLKKEDGQVELKSGIGDDITVKEDEAARSSKRVKLEEPDEYDLALGDDFDLAELDGM